MICHKLKKPERQHGVRVGQGSGIWRALQVCLRQLQPCSSRLSDWGDMFGGMFHGKVFRKNIHSIVSSDDIQGTIQREQATTR